MITYSSELAKPGKLVCCCIAGIAGCCRIPCWVIGWFIDWGTMPCWVIGGTIPCCMGGTMGILMGSGALMPAIPGCIAGRGVCIFMGTAKVMKWNRDVVMYVIQKLIYLYSFKYYYSGTNSYISFFSSFLLEWCNYLLIKEIYRIDYY